MRMGDPVLDELTAPVAAAPAAKKKKSVRRVPSLTQVLYGIITLCAVSLVGYVSAVRDPLGGEPHVISQITKAQPPVQTAETPATSPSGSLMGSSAAPAQQSAHGTEGGRKSGTATAVELENEAGVSVVRGIGEAAPNSVVIRLSEPVTTKLAAAPDSRISERTRFGLLPKTGANDLKAMKVYARPASPTLASGQAPIGRIALVVGGLGISQGASLEAVRRLPPAVTLAFAPYGSDLDRLVAKARENGHEVMIQMPMEPFDYPDSDPGPHTLTVKGSAQENADKLQWVLGRFPGYVGVMNYMGAKLTADAEAIQPHLRAFGERGLFFLDDGTSARSVAVNVARDIMTPVARTDVVVDAVARADVIDKELIRLETLAREKGLAIGNASALPVSVERLSKWAETLERRGFLLVPVSSTLNSDINLLTGTTKPKR
jgi:uncharacterized protein